MMNRFYPYPTLRIIIIKGCQKVKYIIVYIYECNLRISFNLRHRPLNLNPTRTKKQRQKAWDMEGYMEDYMEGYMT